MSCSGTANQAGLEYSASALAKRSPAPSASSSSARQLRPTLCSPRTGCAPPTRTVSQVTYSSSNGGTLDTITVSYSDTDRRGTPLYPDTVATSTDGVLFTVNKDDGTQAFIRLEFIRDSNDYVMLQGIYVASDSFTINDPRLPLLQHRLTPAKDAACAVGGVIGAALGAILGKIAGQTAGSAIGFVVGTVLGPPGELTGVLVGYAAGGKLGSALGIAVGTYLATYACSQFYPDPANPSGPPDPSLPGYDPSNPNYPFDGGSAFSGYLYNAPPPPPSPFGGGPVEYHCYSVEGSTGAETEISCTNR